MASDQIGPAKSVQQGSFRSRYVKLAIYPVNCAYAQVGGQKAIRLVFRGVRARRYRGIDSAGQFCQLAPAGCVFQTFQGRISTTGRRQPPNGFIEIEDTMRL